MADEKKGPIASWGLENIDVPKIKKTVSEVGGGLMDTVNEVLQGMREGVRTLGSSIGAGFQADAQGQMDAQTKRVGPYVEKGLGVIKEKSPLVNLVATNLGATTTPSPGGVTATPPSSPQVAPQVTDPGKGVVKEPAPITPVPATAVPPKPVSAGFTLQPGGVLAYTDREGKTAPVMENQLNQTPYTVPSPGENDTFKTGSLGLAGGKSDQFAKWKDAEGNTQIVLKGWQPVTPEEKAAVAKEEAEGDLKREREKEDNAIKQQFADIVNMIKGMKAPSSNAAETLASLVSEIKGSPGSYDKAGRMTPQAQANIVSLTNAMAHADTSSQNVNANMNERKMAALSAVVTNTSSILERLAAHRATADQAKARLKHDERSLGETTRYHDLLHEERKDKIKNDRFIREEANRLREERGEDALIKAFGNYETEWGEKAHSPAVAMFKLIDTGYDISTMSKQWQAVGNNMKSSFKTFVEAQKKAGSKATNEELKSAFYDQLRGVKGVKK